MKSNRVSRPQATRVSKIGGWIWRQAVVLAMAFVLASCGPKLTDAHLARVEPGMSAQQVEDLIGKPDEERHRTALGFTGTTLVYHTKTSEVKILLVEDQVISVEGKADSP